MLEILSRYIFLLQSNLFYLFQFQMREKGLSLIAVMIQDWIQQSV